MADDILSMLEDASDEWVSTNPVGRRAEPSPYIPAVQASWDEREDGATDGRRFAFNVTLNGRNKDEQDKDLTKHVNLLRKAGLQLEGGPVSVYVQHGDVNRKTGEVRIRFYAREKISRPGAGNAAKATEAKPAS